VAHHVGQVLGLSKAVVAWRKIYVKCYRDIRNVGMCQIFETLLYFLHDCAKSGFTSHFKGQLQIVITSSISNGFP
jgi:hypothetical protein